MTFCSRLGSALWKRTFLWRASLGIIFLSAALSTAKAYVLEGIHWPSSQPIVMGVQLGSANGTLLDGSTTWNQVAESALSTWNPYLGSGVQFTFQETGISPAKNDGNNTVFFSTTVFGESFGQDTLGITLYSYNPRTNTALEADVIFNSTQPFNSYRGNLRFSGASTVFDLHRVAIHEFGHVLGLDHVAQTVQAIMTPFTTNLDTVQADDIAGVEAIYGFPAVAVVVAPVITGNTSANAVAGQPFSYQIVATHNPTSYLAGGLPDGLSVNTSTGVISGTPTTAGAYPVSVRATNTAGTATATLALTVVAMPVATVVVTTPTVILGSGGKGEVTVSLSAAQSTDTLLNYTVKGSAINGTDYVLLSGTKKIKAGLTSKRIKILPQGDLGGAAKKTVKLTLAPGNGYNVGTVTAVKLKIVAAGQ